jgi:hypothetical protein
MLQSARSGYLAPFGSCYVGRSAACFDTFSPDMNVDAFKASLSAPQPPAGSGELLRALWFDAQGNWDEAHRIAQDVETPDGARVHAYLHRKEGDPANARYWYRSAGVPAESGELAAEWEKLVRHLLG